MIFAALCYLFTKCWHLKSFRYSLSKFKTRFRSLCCDYYNKMSYLVLIWLTLFNLCFYNCSPAVFEFICLFFILKSTAKFTLMKLSKMTSTSISGSSYRSIFALIPEASVVVAAILLLRTDNRHLTLVSPNWASLYSNASLLYIIINYEIYLLVDLELV